MALARLSRTAPRPGGKVLCRVGKTVRAAQQANGGRPRARLRPSGACQLLQVSRDSLVGLQRRIKGPPPTAVEAADGIRKRFRTICVTRLERPKRLSACHDRYAAIEDGLIYQVIHRRRIRRIETKTMSPTARNRRDPAANRLIGAAQAIKAQKPLSLRDLPPNSGHPRFIP